MYCRSLRIRRFVRRLLHRIPAGSHRNGVHHKFGVDGTVDRGFRDGNYKRILHCTLYSQLKTASNRC